MAQDLGPAPRTVVTFHSAKFNTSETKPHYINPHSYGDDAAEWLITELAARGIVVVGEVGQEDFGWWLRFRCGSHVYDFVLGYNPDGYWMGWLERKRGIAGSLFGMRKKGIGTDAAYLIHSVLSSSDFISEVRWHNRGDLDALGEDLGRITPV
jgi:hypothetical protein